jgi:hypothetical protein
MCGFVFGLLLISRLLVSAVALSFKWLLRQSLRMLITFLQLQDVGGFLPNFDAGKNFPFTGLPHENWRVS